MTLGRPRRANAKRGAHGKSRGDEIDPVRRFENAQVRAIMHEREARGRLCGIYAITPVANPRPTKIGVSVKPLLRLRSLQTSHWEVLHIAALGYCPSEASAFAVENKAHSLLRELGIQLRGEWFDTDVEHAMDAIQLAALAIGVEFTLVSGGAS